MSVEAYSILLPIVAWVVLTSILEYLFLSSDMSQSNLQRTLNLKFGIGKESFSWIYNVETFI